MFVEVEDFRQREEQIRQVVYSTYGGFCDYFERGFGIYMRAIKSFSGKKWHIYRWEKRYGLILFCKLANTLKSAYELCVTGYYSESVMLARALYEALVRIMFIKKFPGRYEELVGRRFKMGAKEKELGIKESSLYPLMSSFSHGHEVDTFSDLVAIQKGTRMGIYVGPQNPLQNQDIFAVACNILMFYFWVGLVLLVNVLPELEQEAKWLKDYHDYVADLEKNYVRGFVDKKGRPNRIAMKGADEILALVRSLPDWQKPERPGTGGPKIVNKLQE